VPHIYQMHIEHEALSAFETPAGILLRDLVAEQANLLKEQILWLLGALISSTEVQAIERSLGSSEVTARANAMETLEALTTPAFARAMVPLLDRRHGGELLTQAREQFGMTGMQAHQVLAHAWPEMTAASADGMAAAAKTRSGRQKINALLGAVMTEIPDDKPIL